jgi:cysteinyl-tRNA synthetase
MLTSSYRIDFGFSEDDLLSSKKRLDKLYRLKKRLYGIGNGTINKEFKNNILEVLNDDLNTAKAMAIIDEYIALSNDKLDNEPKNKQLKKDIVASIDYLNIILGIGYQDPFLYFQFGLLDDDKKNIEDLILQRNNAKKEKNFILSDEIRDQLARMNISLMDTINGTMWEKL